MEGMALVDEWLRAGASADVLEGVGEGYKARGGDGYSILSRGVP